MQVANAPPSSEHANVDPASVAVNANVASGTVTVPDGPESIVVCGAAVSTVKLRVAALASELPTASVARTENV